MISSIEIHEDDKGFGIKCDLNGHRHFAQSLSPEELLGEVARFGLDHSLLYRSSESNRRSHHHMTIKQMSGQFDVFIVTQSGVCIGKHTFDEMIWRVVDLLRQLEAQPAWSESCA